MKWIGFITLTEWVIPYKVIANEIIYVSQMIQLIWTNKFVQCYIHYRCRYTVSIGTMDVYQVLSSVCSIENAKQIYQNMQWLRLMK